jgi:hypothetical protein
MTLQFCRFARSLLLITASAVVLPSCSGKTPTSPTPPPVAAPGPAPAPAPPRFPAQSYTSTTFSLSSDQGHYVGQGKSLTLTAQDVTVDAQMSANQGFLYIELRVKNSTPLSFWQFHIMSPGGGATRITPGTYETSRDPLLPALVFSVGGDARGCNRSTARLVIHEFEVVPGTLTLRSFRASFEDHHCEGASPSMRGEIAVLEPWK